MDIKSSVHKPISYLGYSKRMAGINGGVQIIAKLHAIRRYQKAYKNCCLRITIMHSRLYTNHARLQTKLNQ